MKKTSITRAFDRFVRDMCRLEDHRFCDCEVPGLTFFVGDAVHHICAILADLEELECVERMEPHAQYEHMSDVQVALGREAYLAVLAIGAALREEEGMAITAPEALAAGRAAIDRMLDALAPYVCAAETSLRRIIVDGVAPEALEAELSNAR